MHNQNFGVTLVLKKKKKSSPFLPALRPRAGFHLPSNLLPGEPFIQSFLHHPYRPVTVGSTWDLAHYVISYSSQQSLYLLLRPGAFLITWMTQNKHRNNLNCVEIGFQTCTVFCFLKIYLAGGSVSQVTRHYDRSTLKSSSSYYHVKCATCSMCKVLLS